MRLSQKTRRIGWSPLLTVILAVSLGLVAGCQEFDTIKRELLKTLQTKIKKKKPFTPREGITITACPLYRNANHNSEVLRKLRPETPVHLIDSTGKFYRLKTRDGREGYAERSAIGGEEIMRLTYELRRSIEGKPVQAEGMLTNKANFRLQPGRHHRKLGVLPAGMKFEMYERVVTLRRLSRAPRSETPQGAPVTRATDGNAGEIDENQEEAIRKDVWYKVKLEDGRVGYIYTHNLRFTPPEALSRLIPHRRIVAWRIVDTTDDVDLGAKNRYVVACTKTGSDPGCDFTSLYYVTWNKRRKTHGINWQWGFRGILPLTNYHYEGKPGFSLRYLHPSKADKLVLASYVPNRGRPEQISAEEIPNNAKLH
ncbi:SH3 domain-containing protein [Thermodesulfobacteriota bacterium]